MTFRVPSSLRTKLLAVMLCTTLVALVVALAAMIGYDLYRFHENSLADIKTQAELLGRTTSPALTFDDPKMAQENLALLHFRPRIRQAAIYNARGGLLATYVASGYDSGFPALPAADATRSDGRTLVVFSRIVEKNGDVLGTVYLRADNELQERVLSYLGIALVVATLAMSLAYLMSWWLQKIITRPILAIAAVARNFVAKRDCMQRAQKTSDDEVGALAQAFNDMLDEIGRQSAERDNANRRLEREVVERRHSEAEVVRLNAELEIRVRERTAELEASNGELLLARKDAERANKAKSEFLSSMSHELRTPLNAIIGFGNILAAEDTLPTTAEQKRGFVSHILKAGKHLLALINDVLDLAKIESGHVTLSLEPVSLAELMQECEQMTVPLASQRGIQTVFPPRNDLHVIADRVRLKQVLLNLLSNAVKYNRDGGAVVVSVAQSAPEQVRVSVQDTGPGLTPQQLAGLFQPFNRLGQEASTVEGTGIGLVVTKRLIEMMEGAIGVSSTVGTGSVFWIDLKHAIPQGLPPQDQPAPTMPPMALPAAGEAVPTPLPTVLYVEDNAANLRLVEEILRFRPDLRFLSAPDARLGIELARAHHPRVILMDINLPGMSGIDALHVLRKDPVTAMIPVIAVTANAMPHDIERGLLEGFFRYITKPIDFHELTAAIDCALAPGRRN